jgi:chemotaxis protein CheD
VTRAPRDVLEVFLQPGEVYFGEERTRISTLLGSCVAITLWHPARRIGGMCHYLLPERPGGRCGGRLDGRYGDEAVEMFLSELAATRTRPAEYQVKVFGGGNMLADARAGEAAESIARRNVERARELIAENGFAAHAEDLGGSVHRFVMLDLWSGDAWVRRGPR